MSEIARQQFQKELQVMIKCASPSVLRLPDLLSDTSDFYIVTEFCHGGDLPHYIQANGYLNDWETKLLFRELVEGAAALHELGLAHRDIKPENILLDSGHHVRVADFGFAADLNEPIPFPANCGTVGYSAPEIIRKVACDPRKVISGAWVLYFFRSQLGECPGRVETKQRWARVSSRFQ
jgi:serine/threonine protein kinase